MEIIRLQTADGDEKCYLRCEIHDWFFDNKPPMVSGCRSCWLCYYLGQRVQMKPELMDMGLEELETALHHMEEEVIKNKWDVELYNHPIVKITKEN